MSGFPVHGHAVVSDDDRIAAADGSMPAALRNEADWAHFQHHLDAAALVVTGRLGHEVHFNKPGRLRLVFSSRADGLHREGDILWFNPAWARWADVLAALPHRGVIAVTGGGGVFRWFLDTTGYDGFHLSRVLGARIPGGRPLFPGENKEAEEVLKDHGLALAEERMLDPVAPVIMKRFERLSPRLDAS